MKPTNFSIQISEENCTGCGNCVEACPLSNPQSEAWKEGKPKIRIEEGIAKISSKVNCREISGVPSDCKSCEEICPTGALSTDKEG